MILGAALAAVLGLALTSVLSAMIERSGPIRLRHWVEGAGGRLLALWEAPGRFEAFRFLLSVIAKVAPAVLAILLLLLPEGLVGGHGRWLALGLVTLLVLLLELINRRLVGRDPETVLRHLTRFYLLALLLLTPLVAIAAPLMPRLDEDVGQFVEGRFHRRADDVDARGHDAAHQRVAEIDDAAHQLALVGIEDALAGADVDEGGDLLEIGRAHV